MATIEDDMPLEERSKLLREVIEGALKPVEAALTQLTSAHASFATEAPEDSIR